VSDSPLVIASSRTTASLVHLDPDRARGAVPTVRRMIAAVATGKCGLLAWRWRHHEETNAPRAAARQRTTRAGWPVRAGMGQRWRGHSRSPPRSTAGGLPVRLAGLAPNLGVGGYLAALGRPPSASFSWLWQAEANGYQNWRSKTFFLLQSIAYIIFP
jgi:hypothetical protein